MLLVAALWHEERAVFQLPFQLEGHYYLLCSAVESCAYLWYGSVKELFIGFIELAFVLECEALIDCSFPYVDVVDECSRLVVGVCDAEHVYIVNRVAHDLALGAEVIEHHILLFELLSLLKSHL